MPSLYVSAKSRSPEKTGEKTVSDRSVWGLVSSRPHRLIVTSTESRLYLLSCKRPRFCVNLRKHNLVARALFTGPPPKPGKSALGMRLEQEPLCSWLEETCKKRKLVCMHFCHVLPCEQRFLSCMAFSHTKEFVIAKSHAREKPLLAARG